MQKYDMILAVKLSFKAGVFLSAPMLEWGPKHCRDKLCPNSRAPKAPPIDAGQGSVQNRAMFPLRSCQVLICKSWRSTAGCELLSQKRPRSLAAVQVDWTSSCQIIMGKLWGSQLYTVSEWKATLSLYVPYIGAPELGGGVLVRLVDLGF